MQTPSSDTLQNKHGSIFTSATQLITVLLNLHTFINRAIFDKPFQSVQYYSYAMFNAAGYYVTPLVSDFFLLTIAPLQLEKDAKVFVFLHVFVPCPVTLHLNQSPYISCLSVPGNVLNKP